jgi:hypothetical protein
MAQITRLIVVGEEVCMTRNRVSISVHDGAEIIKESIHILSS